MKKVIVRKDEDLRLETNSLIKKMANTLIIPILNNLPINSRTFIRKSDKDVNEVIKNVTNHNALEILYNKGTGKSIKKGIEKMAHTFWFHTNNSKAVRNRLKIVNKEIKAIFSKLKDHKDEINVVSIAAGSARAVIEALEHTKINDKIVNVYFVDKNPDALDYSRKLLDNFSISKMSNYSFNWINSTVSQFLNSVDRKFSIVEMVGLMDYFEDQKAIDIFSNINGILDESGHFITANINHNDEKKFLTKVIGWPMYYRTAEDLASLVNRAGFAEENIDLYYEPLEIHSIVISTKNGH